MLSEGINNSRIKYKYKKETPAMNSNQKLKDSPARKKQGLANNSLLSNSSEYEHYEEDLHNYRTRSQSKIEEWNLIQSQYITQIASGSKATKGKPKETNNKGVIKTT